jgi:hypothetical protein
MDLVTAFTFVIVIAGSLAYTNYKFNAAFKACGSGVKATVAPDVVTEAEQVPVAATTRLTLSQKRHLLEAASAKKAAERRAR